MFGYAAEGRCTWATLAIVCMVAASGALSEVYAGSNRAQLYLPGHSGERSLLQQGEKNIQRWEQAHADGGLSRKPDSQGPDSASWSNTVGICSMIRDENATDVREWVLYYRWLGVQHIYLTENADERPPHMVAQLQDFIDEGFLSYNRDATPGGQMKVVRDCLRKHYRKHDWLSFLDVDEFLILRNQDETLRDVLDEFKYEAALSVHWLFVGSSGRTTRPEHGGVLQSYPQCAGEGHKMFKTIANTFYLQNVAMDPHNYEFRDDMQSVDEKHEKVIFRLRMTRCVRQQPEARPSEAIRGRYLFQPPIETCYKVLDQSKPERHIDRIALFHYAVKSEEDFQIKSDKGTAMGGSPKGWDYYNEKNELGSGSEGGVCDLPAQVGKKCCPLDQLTI